MSYYKPSGKFNLSYTAPGILVGVSLTILLAYLYVLLGSWISFIIVKFGLLAVAIYGTLEITKLSNRIAKNRNPLITYFSTLIFSSTLLYFSWFFFVVVELEQDFFSLFGGLWNHVELLFTQQEYEVSTPLSWFADTNGARVSHWETYVVLGGESLLLVLGPLMAIKMDGLDTMLYCESCNLWAKKWNTVKKKCEKTFTTQQFEEMIDQGDLSQLLTLPDADVDNKILFTAYEINIYRCNNCDRSNYIKIRIDNTKLSSSSTVKSEVLLNYYKIDNSKLLEDLKSTTNSG